MTIAVSPRYDAAKLSSGALPDKIDVFEDQMRGWLIEPARIMTGYPHAGFAILAVVLSYFEPIGQFLDGRVGASSKQFTKGFQAVFPSASAVPPVVFDELYNQLRCGMFHRGITKAKVLVGHGLKEPLSVVLNGPDVTSITVDPWLMIDAIDGHLANYVAQLRNVANVDKRSAFEAWFNARAA